MNLDKLNIEEQIIIFFGLLNSVDNWQILLRYSFLISNIFNRLYKIIIFCIKLIVLNISESSQSESLYSLSIKSNNICLKTLEESNIISLVISCSFDISIFILSKGILYLFIIEQNEFIEFWIHSFILLIQLLFVSFSFIMDISSPCKYIIFFSICLLFDFLGFT